jgi:hypothetical protein
VEAIYDDMSSRKLRFHPRKVCGSVGGRGLLRQWKHVETKKEKNSIQVIFSIHVNPLNNIIEIPQQSL